MEWNQSILPRSALAMASYRIADANKQASKVGFVDGRTEMPSFVAVETTRVSPLCQNKKGLLHETFIFISDVLHYRL